MKPIVDGKITPVDPEFKSYNDIAKEQETGASFTPIEGLYRTDDGEQFRLATNKVLMRASFSPLRVEREEGVTDEEIDAWVRDNVGDRIHFAIALQLSERFAALEKAMNAVEARVEEVIELTQKAEGILDQKPF